ncbi:carbohydrate kinase family protein [candidate division WWE3 bacterium]|uniref:Carbohydrate kinase family protein n=1 Tax=candidate division WWE3 bacterium TaxID=2053526 RepID=A0A955RRJ8_UNCKA|nr:carbohydrate kinase family protein [candidate division WWE3 bacterium]
MARIASVGHSTIDIFFELTEGHLQKKGQYDLELCVPFPEKMYIKKRIMSLGGNAVNVGVGLMQDGHEISLVSRTGEDTLGNIIHNDLQKKGFDLTFTGRFGESDSSVILYYDEDRTILSFHGKEQYPFPQSLGDVDYLYLSSLGFSSFSAFHEGLLSWHKDHDATQILYNPGNTEIEAGFDAIKDVILRSHTFIVNLQEGITNMRSTSGVEEDRLRDVGYLLMQYIKQGVTRVVITDGRSGAYFADRPDLYYHVPTIPTKIVDATGAGDAFASGYLIALTHEIDPKEAIKFGIAQAVSAIQVVGATNGVKDFTLLQKIVDESNLQVTKHEVEV